MSAAALSSETISILERLVGFDTTSRDSNLPLIAWVEEFLAARGIASVRAPSADGTKSNLYAVIGPMNAGGIVLSGHTDVVPVDGQEWRSDPWVLTERDGRLFGRGASDMKGFLALALAHADAALAAPLKRPILLAFSHDEEVGCLGVPALIERMGKDLPRPAAVIVGEPTEWKVVSGHKGVRTFVVEVEGREAHSSRTDQGVSAIMEALKIMRAIADEAEAQARAAPGDFTPAGASMTIGLVEGGTATNILARHCKFLWDLRWPPDVDPDAIEARIYAEVARVSAAMQARAPQAHARMWRRSSTPHFAPQRDSAAEALARALTGDNSFHAVSYGTEAGLFQADGLATIVCGPGSIEQAHQPDEWIAREQIDEGVAFMSRLISHLCA